MAFGWVFLGLDTPPSRSGNTQNPGEIHSQTMWSPRYYHHIPLHSPIHNKHAVKSSVITSWSRMLIWLQPKLNRHAPKHTFDKQSNRQYNQIHYISYLGHVETRSQDVFMACLVWRNKLCKNEQCQLNLRQGTISLKTIYGLLMLGVVKDRDGG